MRRRSFFFVPFVVMLTIAPACGSFSENDVPGDGGPPSAEAAVGEAGLDAAAEAGEGGSSETGAVEAPLELAAGFTALSGITATETDVYFVEQGQGGVHGVPLDGSAKEHRIGSAAGSPRSIVLVGSELYWCDVSLFQLKKIQTNGTGFVPGTVDMTRRLVEVAALPDGLVVLAANATTNPPVDGYVTRTNLDLMPVSVTAVSFQNPVSIATRGPDVFWSEGFNGAIGHSATVANSELLASGEPDPGSVAVDASGVYWARPSAGLVRGKIGGADPSIVASAQDHPSSLAADVTSVYWITGDGFIRRVSHGSAPVVDVTSGFQPLPVNIDLVRALAVTTKYVVWLTGDGKVLRAPK
jgi:hypothetical protein